MRGRGLGGEQGAAHIDAELAVEVVFRHLVQGREGRHAGVDEQDVDAAVPPGHIVGQRLGGGRIGLVGQHHLYARQLGPRRLQAVGIGARGDHGRPFRLEQARSRCADTRGAARDEGDLALQPGHDANSFRSIAKP